ncbi:MAG TPA: phosphate ABC transporter permease subunit PstC [Mycobacteriales bacterium]|nr:phosphate ABC transporter permease subunit PstC [Mycobacteriales bacterium]
MTTAVGPLSETAGEPDVPRALRSRPSVADQVYARITTGAGVTVLAIMLVIGGFLSARALEAIVAAGWSFFTTAAWQPEGGEFGIAAILTGTVLIGLTAIVIAVPLAFGTALYISEYAPTRIRRFLINLVDLMAAVPSVVYGLWGFFLLQPQLLVVGPQGEGIPRWLATWMSWIPLFQVQAGGVPVDPRDPATTGTVFTSSIFIAGVVVALMVAPITCSIMRESFSQAPLSEREGAYALGATRWGMIRSVVLPFGAGGMIGGTMLGLGRALGETIAVYMVISIAFDVKIRILENGGSSVSALIALRFGEASEFGTSALMAAGLALFLLTLVVNFGASAVIARSRSGAVSDA